MGKEEGDEVVVRTPAGARNFEIKRLTTIHDQVEKGLAADLRIVDTGLRIML